MNSARDFDEAIPDLRPQGDTPLRSCQLVMLRLLKIFDAICNEAGLQYWLDGGTLLGAMRHSGFIPWDDDVDVKMPIDDYHRFLALASDVLPYDIFLQTRETDPAHPGSWAKLRDRFSFMDDPGGPFAYSQGIPIDIFPAVYMTVRRHRLRKLFSLLPPYNLPPQWPLSHWSFKHKLYSGIYATLQAIARPVLRLKPISRAFNNWGDKGNKLWVNDYPIEWMREAFPDDVMFPLRKIRFEDAEFLCPANPARYLSTMYGSDYMTPPPEGKRGGHAVDGFLITGPNPHFSGLRWEDYAEKKRRAAGAGR
jgi:lipopolysaccharide cholinephosphotransferase